MEQAVQQGAAVALVVVQLVGQPAVRPAVQPAVQPDVHHVKPVADELVAVAMHAAVVHPWPAENQHLGPKPCGQEGLQLGQRQVTSSQQSTAIVTIAKW